MDGEANGHITDSIFRSKLEFAANESDRIIENFLKNQSLTKLKLINQEQFSYLMIYRGREMELLRY